MNPRPRPWSIDHVRGQAAARILEALVEHDAKAGDDWTFASQALAASEALWEAGLLRPNGGAEEGTDG